MSTLSTEPALAKLLLRDRVLLVGGLVVVTIATWAYTIDMAWGGHGSHASGQHAEHAHHAHHGMAHSVSAMLTPHAEHQMSVGMLIVMWIVMMIAMMLPSAGPVGMLHARFVRAKNGGEPAYLTGMFLVGYCVVWAGFSTVAALVQAYLERSQLMSPVAMALFSSVAGGITLVVAGAFQFSPWKNACLHQCRTPIGFLMTEWQDGASGSFVMGLKNGLFCLGCCWAIMALLFVGGVMSMLWMAGLTALMLIEKIAPHGDRVAKAAGVAMIIGGVFMLFSG